MATSGVKKVQRKIFGTGVMEATTADSQVNECAVPVLSDDVVVFFVCCYV